MRCPKCEHPMPYVELKKGQSYKVVTCKKCGSKIGLSLFTDEPQLIVKGKNR